MKRYLKYLLLFLSFSASAQHLPCPPTYILKPASCHNTSDGKIILYSGLNASYQWSNGQTGSIVTGLSKGTYNCTMSYSGHSRTDSYFIPSLDELKTGRQPRQNPITVGTQVTINPSGGSGNITSRWIHYSATGQVYFIHYGSLLLSYTPQIAGWLYIQTLSEGCLDNAEIIQITN